MASTDSVSAPIQIRHYPPAAARRDDVLRHLTEEETTWVPTTRPPSIANWRTKHRTLWGLGDYGTIAAEVVAPLGPELVAATGIGPGTRVLDVAAGTGNAAIAAALAGAEVVATDLVPELLAQGQRLAAAAGVGLVWQEANAEALPFGDGEFDTVLSCIGVMFAPHHEQAAAELVRVCRPGGTIGVISWTPEGFIGQMFATMKPFVPAPPPGVSPPPLWGNADHVTALLGDRVTDVVTTRRAPDRGPVPRRGGVPGLLQGQLRAHHHRLPRHRRPNPNGSPHSMRRWPNSATAHWPGRRRWSGSTCWSPRAQPVDQIQRRRGGRRPARRRRSRRGCRRPSPSVRRRLHPAPAAAPAQCRRRSATARSRRPDRRAQS